MNRRLLALLATASIAIGGACGASGGTGGGGEKAADGFDRSIAPRDLVLASATKASEASSVAFEATVSMPFAGHEVTARGVMDNAKQLMSMTMDMGALLGAQGVEGQGDAEMIFDGKAFYMRFAPLTSQLGGKEWLRFDLEALSEASGVDLSSMLDQFKSFDPKAQLEMLSKTAGEVKEVGTETVRGVSTRHLQIELDLKEAMAQLPGMDQLGSQFIDQSGMSTLPMELWVDEDGLPRRIGFSMDLSKVVGEQLGSVRPTGELTMSMTMEFFDFGKSVDVDVPGPDDYVDAADLGD